MSEWVLVPKFAPTADMYMAGLAAWEEWQNGHCIEPIYEKMLAARPPIPAAVLDAMVERGAETLYALNPDWFGNVHGARNDARACILASLTGDA